MNNQSKTPPQLAFLSHASEDKDAFAEPLGRELARLGVRPWLDKWEIRPGDSLVQKLFDEGLGQAEAVIVVVSRYSVSKPWVREELDSATVRRILHGTRLIPVRLDEVEMPPPLAHLLWINAERTQSSVQRTADQIAHTLHNHDARPTVAPQPAYFAAPVTIPGLTCADALLLVETIRESIDNLQTNLLAWTSVKARAEEAGLRGDAVLESLHALEQAGHIKVTRILGGDPHYVGLTLFGYTVGVSAVIPDIDDIHERIIARLVNQPPSGNDALAKLASHAETNKLVVDQLLHNLETRGLVRVVRFIGGEARVLNVSPTLRRLLT